MNIFQLNIKTDYTHQNSSDELMTWIAQLKEIKKEIKTLYAEDKCSNNPLIKNAIILQDANNQSVLDALKNYKEFRDYWNTCDAVQGSMAFVNEHKKHKSEYSNHLKNYRIFRSKLTN